MKVEVGQVWYDAADDHIEIVFKIDPDKHQVGVGIYESDGMVKPQALDYVDDPIEVYEEAETNFHLATTLDDILEICKNERRKTMHKV
jgi:hypothetical protein